MWLWFASACVPKVPPPPAIDLAVAPVGAPWSTRLFADDPLVGRIWNRAQGAWATEDQLVADLRQAPFVLLGEKHDNPDHHRLQARLVTALSPQTCAFEMLDESDAIGGATTSAEVAARSGWDSSGWPPFTMYQPVFDACFTKSALVVGAHPNRARVMAAMEPDAPWPAGVPRRPLGDAARKALTDEIVAGHCGQLPAEHTAPMVSAQTLKDAWMAWTLSQSAQPAVLIAGTGHTDAVHGVPTQLDAPSRSVAFVEVDPSERDPARYGVNADWIWFTPAVDDLDPCAAFDR